MALTQFLLVLCAICISNRLFRARPTMGYIVMFDIENEKSLQKVCVSLGRNFNESEHYGYMMTTVLYGSFQAKALIKHTGSLLPSNMDLGKLSVG